MLLLLSGDWADDEGSCWHARNMGPHRGWNPSSRRKRSVRGGWVEGPHSQFTANDIHTSWIGRLWLELYQWQRAAFDRHSGVECCMPIFREKKPHTYLQIGQSNPVVSQFCSFSSRRSRTHSIRLAGPEVIEDYGFPEIYGWRGHCMHFTVLFVNANEANPLE